MGAEALGGNPRRSEGIRSAAVAGVVTAVAATAWWSTATAPMPAAFPAFLGGWIVMMTAMMLPALVPVLSVYRRASRRGTVAPLPVFVGGYLAVWSAAALPAYVAWRALQPSLMDARPWTGRLAGGALLLAAAYQLTPLKAACLRGCRSPLTSFTAVRGSLAAPRVALRVGARNGLWCLGCCWALMGVLVAVGVMQPWWMVGIAAVIFTEKALPWGPRASRPFAVTLTALGLSLLLAPHWLSFITS